MKKLILFLIILTISAAPFTAFASQTGWNGVWANGETRIIIINGGLRVCVDTPGGYYLLTVDSADEETIYGTVTGSAIRYEISLINDDTLRFSTETADSGIYGRTGGDHFSAYESVISDGGRLITPRGNGINIIYNGSYLSFDVAPQIMNGRTMVPLRTIFEAMGAEIEWNGDTQTVTATRGNTVVVLTIGSTSPTVNGQTVSIDQPGLIVDGRTLAPLRFVAEAFGGTVEWDGETQTATIAM